jgi:hypothetical protein
MMIWGSSGICGAVLGLALAPALVRAAEPGPVPPAISAARRVFISNAGMDGISLAIFRRAADKDQPYNTFYAAMKSWGRYELVRDPSEADLVFEIRFVAPLTDADKLPTYAPQFHLTVMDAKSRFILWSLAAPVEGAIRKATWYKNVDVGMADLMADLKAIAGQAP